MSKTLAIARDDVMGVVNTAWLASGTTSGIELRWADNKYDPPNAEAADGNVDPWAEAGMKVVSSGQETLGGVGQRKHQTEALLTVAIYTRFGDGHTLADAIVQVLQVATRNIRVGNLWFFDGRPNEVGVDGPWYHTNFLVGVRFEEIS